MNNFLNTKFQFGNFKLGKFCLGLWKKILSYVVILVFHLIRPVKTVVVSELSEICSKCQKDKLHCSLSVDADNEILFSVPY